MSKSKNKDKIFEDLLNNDFVNVFKPCFYVQRLFGTLGVNIEFKFITPPSKLYKVYSFVTWLVTSLCVVHAVVACDTQFDALSTDIPLKIGLILNGIGNSLLVWKSVFYSGHARCQLYVKLQKIERSLKIKNVKRMNEILHMMTWFLVGISFFLGVTWITIFNKYLIKDYCPSASVASVVSSAIYLEICHVFTILYFISLRVEYIKNKLRQEIKDCKKQVVVSPFDFKAKDHDKVGDELVYGMFYVLDSFADTMDIFPHALFAFTSQMLAWQLITMQNLVVSFKKQMSVDIASFLCSLPSSMIFMVLMLILCFISQSLMTRLDQCAELCTTLTFSLDDGKSRENTKRITNLLKGKRNATVFDIFTLDTQLPLHLLGVTASYTIVLLHCYPIATKAHNIHVLVGVVFFASLNEVPYLICFVTMKEVKYRKPEYLSRDILDEDFVKTFTVFLRLQYYLGSCRVEAKDQFVTSPTTYQKLYTIFCIIVIIFLNVIAIKYYFSDSEDYALYILCVVVIWATYVNYLLITINTRFFNGQDNANFFIRLQKLDRLMGLDRDNRLNNILKRINNTSMILFLMACSIIVLVSVISREWVNLTFTGAFLCQVTGITELIFYSNLLIYFVIRLRFINCIIKNHLSRNKAKKKTDNYVALSRRSLKKLALETHDFVTTDTTAYLKEVFGCFALFSNLYRFQLFIFCLKLVVVSLLVFGVILICVQRNLVDMVEMTSLGVYTIIDVCIAIFLGFRLQLFFGEVKETKRVSIDVMAEYTSGHLRDKARKMMKIIEETPPKLSIYDMWEMDAGIFVTIFGLVTSLIVTLLQFAFL